MKNYIPPSIYRQHAQNGNRHASGPHAGAMEGIDGVSVDELMANHGSPVYVFSERTIREQIQSYRKAFESRYANTQFAWSYKTNYLDAICQIFHSEGSIAEVVSDFEYEKARRNGIAGEDIVYNGPHKSRTSLERAIAEGAMIQVDHLDELQTLEDIAREWNRTVKVALRVHLDAGVRPVWTKFGFNLDDGEAYRVILRIAESAGLLQLRGLHTHIGTYILEPNAYGVATRKLLTLADAAWRDAGFAIDYINLGGGFPSSATLHYAARPAAETNPPIEEYAAAICNTLHSWSFVGRSKPRLILETGRALIDDAGYLLSSVTSVKNADDIPNPGQGFDPKGVGAQTLAGLPTVMCDAGVHLLYTGAWYRIGVKASRPRGGQCIPVRLAGCLCMNIDILREHVVLPPVVPGDALVMHPVGAYNVTQSMQFIAYRPRVVLIDERGRQHVVRERERLDDIVRLERLPEHLGTGV